MDSKLKSFSLYPESLYIRFKNKSLSHATIIETSNLKKAMQDVNSMLSALMCLSDKLNPCGVCNSCVKISVNSHPDVKLVSPEEKSSAIKIKDIRLIRQDAYVLPTKQKYKVYIISPADALTFQAQNAFIKILEEPPKNVIFILICESLSSLLSTILSRCEIFRDCRAKSGDEDSQIYGFAKEIFNASCQNNKFKVLETISKLPLDRPCLKSLILKLQELFVNSIKNTNFVTSNLIEKIDKLEYILSTLDVNSNLNLVLSYLSAVL